MPIAQQKRAPSETARSATIWVVNSDAQVRKIVETAIGDYPLHRKVCLLFSEDLSLLVTAPPPDVVLINLTAPTESCFSLLPEILSQWPETDVIFLCQSDNIHLWAEAIQLGAYEFLPRSVECRQLGWVLQEALWTSRRRLSRPPAPSV